MGFLVVKMAVREHAPADHFFQIPGHKLRRLPNGGSQDIDRAERGFPDLLPVGEIAFRPLAQPAAGDQHAGKEQKWNQQPDHRFAEAGKAQGEKADDAENEEQQSHNADADPAEHGQQNAR